MSDTVTRVALPTSDTPVSDQPHAAPHGMSHLAREVTDPSYAAVNLAEAKFDNGGDLLNTATNAYGRPISRAEITPQSRVTVHGMEMTVATAMREGLIIQRNGEFHSTQSTSQSAQTSAPRQPTEDQEQPTQSQQQAEADTAPMPFESDIAEQSMTFLVEKGGQGMEAATVKAAMSLADTGSIHGGIVNDLSQAALVEPEVIHMHGAQVLAAFEEQARKFAWMNDVRDWEAFSRWVSQRPAAERREVFTKHALMKNPSVYKDWLAAYKRSR